MNGRYDTLVVGAGFAGSIMAERLATRCGQRVLVIDRRDHIAGNAYDYLRRARRARAPVRAAHLPHERREGRRLPVALHRVAPVRAPRAGARRRAAACRSRSTARRSTSSTGSDLSTRRGGRGVLRRARGADRATSGPARTPSSPRSAASSTRSSSAATRASSGSATRRSCTRRCARGSRSAPTTDDRYFTDSFQNMPADGYTAMFERMLDQPGIEVSVEHRLLRRRATRSSTTTSSAPARSTATSTTASARCPTARSSSSCATSRRPDGGLLFSPPATINEPERGRAVHAHDGVPAPDRAGRTTRSTLRGRVPAHRGRPVLPDPQRRDPRALQALRGARPPSATDVTFVGRLARYQYLNMDQVVGQALATAEKLIASLPERA